MAVTIASAARAAVAMAVSWVAKLSDMEKGYGGAEAGCDLVTGLLWPTRHRRQQNGLRRGHAQADPLPVTR
jgi:hypothetical protein